MEHNTERVYYRVGADSPVMAVVEDARQKQRVFCAAMKELGVEFGAPIWATNDARFVGVGFTTTALPAGWRKGKSCAVPDKRVKAGRDLVKRFDALPVGVDSWRFARLLNSALGVDYMHWGSGNVYFPVFRLIGETGVLGLDSRCIAVPPGCTRLKMSEYFALVESQEEILGIGAK